MHLPLYQPSSPQSSPTFRFLRRVNELYALNLRSYQDLYNWSCSHLHLFWSLVWDETDIIGHKGSHVIDISALPADNPSWFANARLNWAENMLQSRSPTKVALIEFIEPTSTSPIPRLRSCTYAHLYNTVADLVSALISHGVKEGDRVASYASNCIETIALCLATTAIGGIWVSAAADFGPAGVIERFRQVQPKLIFAVHSVSYNNRIHLHLPKLSALLSGLSGKIPPPKVVVASTIQGQESEQWETDWIRWDDFIAEGKHHRFGQNKSGDIIFRRLPFDAPLWILFSSGTTGMPKPIVHRAGGMLLQAKKEFVICGNLSPKDVFFYYTTTGWMMWNFLVASLSVGCTLVLYDGSPLRDVQLLWNMVDDLKVTIFGTSAKYLDNLSKKYSPRKHHDLSSLRQIYSTGSPLAPQLFDYVYEKIHPKVLLGSITGGTDICSLFAGMCTALPVFRGEIQCRMLGMAVESYSEDGKRLNADEPGELVCTQPFPCMPLGFWPLPGFGPEEDVQIAQKRFFESYFAKFDGIWYHGDHIVISSSKLGNGGGLIMLGRSDGVLNPGGIRFGSAEIYEVLDACFPSVISDYLAIGQMTSGGTDERVILFVKLPIKQELSASLASRIKAEIRVRRSARHTPARIIQVPDVPYTLNGKRVEVLVKKLVNGAPLSSVNPATLLNPECLQFYCDIGESLRAESK